MLALPIDRTTLVSLVATKLTPDPARAAQSAAAAENIVPSWSNFTCTTITPISSERFVNHVWVEAGGKGDLTDDHASYLQWRANSELVVAARGIRSRTTRAGKIECGFTGAALENMIDGDNDVLMIPLYSLRHGPEEPVLFQARPDHPRSVTEYEKNEDGSHRLDEKGSKVLVLGKNKKPRTHVIKFEAPAGAERGSDVGDLPADVHPLGQAIYHSEPGAVLAWTEGAAKADAILSCALREGLAVVPFALTGVTMGYQRADSGFNPNPVLVPDTVGEVDHDGRLELLFWDADWRTNRAVGNALITFGTLLEQAGATVAIVDTPGVTKDGKGGIDDFLQAKLMDGSTQPLSDLLATSLVSLADAAAYLRTYSNDDLGRSERLVDQLLAGRTHTFDPTIGAWNGYDTARGIWTDGPVGTNVVQIAKDLTERDVSDPGRYAAARSANAIRSATVLAASDPRVQLRSDECDLDPYLLNTTTGIVDLRTAELLPHSAQLAMRKVTAVGYDPAALCPAWDRFVLQCASGDVEYRDFLQRFYGMALIGRPIEEVMAFITGGGRNGKSTFSGAIQRALGTYADTFPAKGFTGDLTDEMLIGLQGIRLAIAAETGAGNALDEQAVKSVTSSDMISGRALYKSRVTFCPSATMTLLTNHRPSVRAGDEGTWRRIRILPFNHQVSDAEKDPDLALKLDAEASGILRWLVNGCLAFLRDGLGTCDVVDRATRQYRDSQDLLGGFIREMLVIPEDRATAHTKRATIKNAFDLYCQEQGRRTSWTLASFREGLQERGILPRETKDFERTISGYPRWYGIGINADHPLLKGDF